MLHNARVILQETFFSQKKNLPFEMLPDAILSDVFRQISNPQVTCLSNHFAPNSSFGIGCCGIVWRHCTTTHNLDRNNNSPYTLHRHTKRAIFRSIKAGWLYLSLPFSSASFHVQIWPPRLLSSLDLHRRRRIVRVPHFQRDHSRSRETKEGKKDERLTSTSH